jgi:N-acetylneuraminic acid mutarotase
VYTIFKDSFWNESRVPRIFHLLAIALAACGRESATPSPPPSPGASSGDAWARLAAMNESRQEVCVAEIGGRIYVAGGYLAGGATSSTLEVYDVERNAWSFLAPMPRGLNHCMAAAVSGRLYVIGGALASGADSAETMEYDPQANAWRLRAPMPTARSAAMAAVLNGRIYVAGGTGGGRALEVYDPQADSWSALPLMPTPRNHLAGGIVGSRLLAVGGRPPNTLNVNEAFDTTNGIWSSLAPMPTGRSGHAAAVVRGCLYTFGGEGNPAAPTGVFPQNEVYDPRANTWQTLTPMPTPRHGIAAAVIGERIFIPGGAATQGFGVVAAHEVYTVPAGKTCQ